MKYGLSFNGIHSNTYEVVVKSKNRQILPATNDVYLEIPGRAGSYLIPREVKDRTIEVECALVRDSLEELRTAMRDISAWLNTRSKVQLIFDDEPDKYYLAKLSTQIDITQKYTLGQFALVFRCEPYAYSIITKTPTFVSDSIDITNAGTAPIYPKFVIIFTSSATEYTLVLGSNYMHIVRDFVIGDVLVIDHDLSKVTVNDLNAMSSLDLGSRFFPIPIGDSEIIPSPLGHAQVTVNYKERWL